MATSDDDDLQAVPPTATVIPKAIAIILPTVTTAITAFNAIRRRVLKDFIHEPDGFSFSHSFDRRGLSVRNVAYGPAFSMSRR